MQTNVILSVVGWHWPCAVPRSLWLWLLGGAWSTRQTLPDLQWIGSAAGGVLPPGSCAFEVANPDTSNSIVECRAETASSSFWASPE